MIFSEILKLNKQKKAGFTLIELLVAMAVFSLAIVAIVGIFISGLRAQRRIIALQKVQDNGRYITEMITKELRMSLINSAAGGPMASVNVTNSADLTFDYAISGAKIWRNGVALTPDNVEVVSGAFYVTKTTFPSTARLTMALKLRSTESGLTGSQPEIDLQTTVAARSTQ